MELRSLLKRLDEIEDFNRLVESAQAGISVNAAGPIRPYLAGALAARARKPVLAVTARPVDAERFANDARAFHARTLLLPAPETLPAEPISPSPASVGRHFAALDALAEGDSLIVAPIAALLRRIPAAATGLHLPARISRGDEAELYGLADRLGVMGFRRATLVENRGEFAVRGGLLDLFPPTADHPIRIELFGDEIESIRAFSVGSQRAIGELDEALVYRCREVPLDSARFAHAAEALKSAPWFAEEISLLKEGLIFDGIERFIPLIFEELATPFDYLSPGGLVIVDSPGEVAAEAARFIEMERQQLERAIASGVAPQLDYYVEPESLLDRPAVKLVSGPAEIAFESGAVQPVMGQLDKLAGEVKSLAGRGLDVVVALPDPGQIKRIGELLEEAGVTGAHLAAGELSTGFVFLEARVAILSYSDLFFHRHERRPVRMGARLTDLADLEVGDYVVHAAHGIARYAGLTKRTLDGVERDYLLLEYAEGDKLFVPVDHLDRVGKYIGPDGEIPSITRLGSPDWARAKKKAKEAAKKMAYDLLALYAARARARGFAFSPDTPWQRELEEGFPFEETPDQRLAIDEVKVDMETERPMDRLVCGDVGFGKTEVALRAAFKAVMDGKQVILLVPTTILAQQHYETFRERFAPFPVIVELLSRFRSQKEQKTVVDDFNVGKVDVLVGTHRTLSKDVTGKNIGLVVVDEEQRFGVSAKEQLKNMKKSVDFLTLSATPIPRTLQMALSGLRDLSTIETPPEDRHPIATYVGPYDEGLVRDAILRELARGGQCFFVHNHIETISAMAERLRALVPEATIAIAHGRMAERQLEKVMIDFLDKRFDVLVSTTIIENGLDIPSVNTLVVDRADRLGLAQLYQLRGRVGRSDERAYSYFFYEPGMIIATQALERLKALGEHTGLGSGIKIALKDLEIRGAGNLLGAEQHGYMAAVGFELYCDLLREAIEELEGKAPEERPAVTVDLPLDAYLPESYIDSERLRIEAYRKVTRATKPSDIDALEGELVDRYGPLPQPARDLLDVAKVKLHASRVGLSGVKWQREALVLSGGKFDDEWGAAIAAVDAALSSSIWLGNLTITGLDGRRALSFLLKLFSDIMSEFEPQG